MHQIFNKYNYFLNTLDLDVYPHTFLCIKQIQSRFMNKLETFIENSDFSVEILPLSLKI